jgi:hypothetical protein
LSQCPHDHACMQSVTADSVLARIDRILSEPVRK